jgi:hypothetical protein
VEWSGCGREGIGVVRVAKTLSALLFAASASSPQACFVALFPHYDHLQLLCTSAHHPPCCREPPKEPRRYVTSHTLPIGPPDIRIPHLTSLHRRSCGAHRDALPAPRWPREVCSATLCSPSSAAHLEMLTGLQPSLRSTRTFSSPPSSAASTRLL